MTIQKWDPFYEMDKFFNTRTGRGNASATASCVMPVDIIEAPGEVLIKAEVPGIDPADVEVKVEDGVLTISGEKKLEAGTGEENNDLEYQRIERYYGKFTRSFVVPRYVDSANVQAEYRAGILTLKLPRKEETQPRRIEVKVSGE